MSRSRWFVGFTLLVAVCGARAADTPAYARLARYSDDGVSLDARDGDMSFETDFARPDRLRFAFEAGHPFILLRHEKLEQIVRGDGIRATLWSDAYDVTEKALPSLGDAVAAATGVSRAAVHHTATLLMPHLRDADPFGSSVLALQDAGLRNDEPVDGVPCRHVHGTTSRGHPVDVWIAKDDSLVRRIDVQWAADQPVITELHRHVRTDPPIPPAVFDTTRPPTRIDQAHGRTGTS